MQQEVIILDLDGGLIEIMLSFLCRVEDMESTSKIIIASSFATLKNEILIPIPPMWLSIWYHLLPAMSLRYLKSQHAGLCCHLPSVIALIIYIIGQSPISYAILIIFLSTIYLILFFSPLCIARSFQKN